MVPEHSSPGYGGRRQVAAVALERVGTVDARGDHLEEDLAVAQRRGVLHLLRLQHLWGPPRWGVGAEREDGAGALEPRVRGAPAGGG
jgi:hypothetical protein